VSEGVNIRDYRPIGAWWCAPSVGEGTILTAREALQSLGEMVYVVVRHREVMFGVGGSATLGTVSQSEGYPLLAVLPPCTMSSLGETEFRRAHGVKYALYAGAMANGIASEEVVEAMSRAGMLGFFGSAGLSPERIEQAIVRLNNRMPGKPFGFNFINTPGDTEWPERVVDLFLQHGVRVIEASAFIRLSLPLIRYRLSGIHRDASGRVVAPNRVIAKVSRVEVAKRFFAPPPEKYVAKLVEAGVLTEEQGAMASEIPVAQDVTFEADSGGHTDHRPAISSFSTMLAARDERQERFEYAEPLRVGLAGGIGTPQAVAAAFGMGAAYVVTGSINQACREAGTSDTVRSMLAAANTTDVALAPAADMFEMGVTVQVLKKGTRFATRAQRLYRLYSEYEDLDALPEKDVADLERDVFRQPLNAVWEETKAFFEAHDAKQVAKAEKSARHKMALVFRWYLGQSSTWANTGVPDRQDDYQVWCGPAMGACNVWLKNSYMEDPANRRVAEIAMNLLRGAAVCIRASILRRQSFPVPEEVFCLPPAPPDTWLADAASRTGPVVKAYAS